MSNQAYLSIRIHFALSVFVLQYSVTANAQEQPKPNAIIIGGGKVQFPNSNVKNNNEKPIDPVQQNFQRALMKLRKSQRNKISPEAKKRADQALMHMNILTNYYVDNVRDAAKTDLNNYNKVLFGNSANRFITTNDVRVSNGYLAKSGNPYVDMANDSITVQIKRILVSNPGKEFTIAEIYANIVYQIQDIGKNFDSALSPESINLLYKQLSIIESHVNQLVDSGFVNKKKAKLYEVLLETETSIFIKKYLSYVYSIK